MKRKHIFTVLLFLITLCTPLSLLSQDFEMNGTVLVRYNGNAAKITIPNRVTSISDWAFIGCSSLTSITIPPSVTTIGDGAFSWCSSLTSIIVDTKNSAYSSVDGILFNKNRTVIFAYPAGKQEKTYTIPTSVTSIGDSAFSGCSNLTSITIPPSVTSIGDVAFSGCSSLTSITIPPSVTSIGEWAFSWCSNLTSITIPPSVTSIGDKAFSERSSLTSITVDIQNGGYSSVDGILFNKNRTVIIAYPAGKQGRTYTIPTSVTTIGDSAFSGCSSLTSITIPSSVTSIRNGAFSGCSSLTSITIPASVTDIFGSLFPDCKSLTSITVDPQNSKLSSAEGVLFTKDRTLLIAYPAGKKESHYNIPVGVRVIWYDAFYGCNSLVSITISTSVTSIGNGAFSGCSSLISVTIPSSVDSIEYGAFSECTSLGTVVVSRRTIIEPGAFPSTARITYSD